MTWDSMEILADEESFVGQDFLVPMLHVGT